MKNVETKERTRKEFLGSTKLNNIIAFISVGISIISLFTASRAIQRVGDISADNVTVNQSVNDHPGLSVEDADYISKDNDKEMMDKAYNAEDILKLVDENPNLSFCLLWHGSQEEYDATDWDKMPPNVKIEMYDEKTNTFTISYK